jgi:MOSC domain-containing protein YiiM
VSPDSVPHLRRMAEGKGSNASVGAQPGAYLRVIQAGEIRASDPVDIVYRPPHDVSIEWSSAR